jgi:hypothetical protein
MRGDDFDMSYMSDDAFLTAIESEYGIKSRDTVTCKPADTPRLVTYCMESCVLRQGCNSLNDFLKRRIKNA